MKLYYRLCNTTDPEERLEDAAMWKAMRDIFGEEISLIDYDAKPPQDGYMFGRGRNIEYAARPHLLIKDGMPYWQDPAFLANCRRHFEVLTWEGALRAIENLHGDGKGAFLKATDTKLMTMRLPVGGDMTDLLDAWAYSFIDRPPCLMVQELVEMRYERRFVVIDRKIVTQSPIAAHLTPLDYSVGNLHYDTPRAPKPALRSPELTQDMTDFVGSIAESMVRDHAVIDVAEIDGSIGIVEFNAARIGQFGLYACDPHAIARAVKNLLHKQIQEAA